jgi:predicted nucleic acid-binding protein
MWPLDFLFTFSTYSPEPLVQFNQGCQKSFLGKGTLQMKDNPISQEEIHVRLNNKRLIIVIIYPFFSNILQTSWSISIKLGRDHP